MLFEIEGTTKAPEDALAYGAGDVGATADVASFARTLVDGCVAGIEAVDGAIADASTNWRLAELGKVERAILRMGVFELLYMGGTPVPVVIDESVELAKAYAGDQAGRFVNGVLGQVAASRTGRIAAEPS